MESGEGSLGNLPDITGYPPPLCPPWPLAKIHNYMAVIIMRVGAKFKQQNRMPKKREQREEGKRGSERESEGRREGSLEI